MHLLWKQSISVIVPNLPTLRGFTRNLLHFIISPSRLDVRSLSLTQCSDNLVASICCTGKFCCCWVSEVTLIWWANNKMLSLWNEDVSRYFPRGLWNHLRESCPFIKYLYISAVKFPEPFHTSARNSRWRAVLRGNPLVFTCFPISAKMRDSKSFSIATTAVAWRWKFSPFCWRRRHSVRF